MGGERDHCPGSEWLGGLGERDQIAPFDQSGGDAAHRAGDRAQ